MTEVPEHLLQRSRDRRQALGLAPIESDTGAPTPEVAATVSASAPAVTGATAPAAAGKAPVPLPATAPPAPPDPTPPWVEAANSRQRIPMWVMPVLLFLPIWAFMYVGTLENPTRLEGLIYEGGEIYAANCASCHGATGGGGSGPALAGGAVITTFSTLEDQVEWVVKATQGFKDEGRATYGDTNKPVGGGGVMKQFAGELTAEEITLAVMYERIELGGNESDLALGEALFDAFEHGEIELGGQALEQFPITITNDQIVEAFAGVRAALATTETAAG